MFNKRSVLLKGNGEDLQLKVHRVQEKPVEYVRVLVHGPQEDLHLHQVHHHPVGREHVPHEVLKHDERLHQEVLKRKKKQKKTRVLGKIFTANASVLSLKRNALSNSGEIKNQTHMR